MKKCIVFGAGTTTKQHIHEILADYNVLGITDNDSYHWGNTIENIKVIPPSEALKLDFDAVVMCNMAEYITYAWIEQLSDAGVSRDKLVFDYCVYNVDARQEFLKSLAAMMYDQNTKGSTAEVGVYRGDFARHINMCFPDRKLYLFDTFEGFSTRDLKYESEEMQTSAGRYGNTSVDYVISKMPHPDNCVIKKGFFPDTASGLEDSFCFVNLDTDLYAPTLSGLEFFHSRLEKGGVILVHDYFCSTFAGVTRAVNEWAQKHPDFACIPVGDGISVALTNSNIFGVANN